jgi:hypothetical protein
MPSNSEHNIIGKGVDYLALLVTGAVEGFDGRFDEDCTTKHEQVVSRWNGCAGEDAASAATAQGA